MFCENCGNQIPENVKFCPNCGKTVASENGEVQKESASEKNEPANIKTKKYSKKSKWKKVMILVLSLIVVLAGVGSYCYFTSPVYTMQKDLKAEKVSEAVVVYNYDIAGNKLLEKVAENILAEYIQTLISEYENGEKEYDIVYEFLSALTGLNCEELSGAAEEGMMTIQTYQKNESVYQEAEELYENENYEEAIEKYKLVTKDSDVYEVAQERIKDSQAKYKEKVLAQTEAPATLTEYENCLKVLEGALEILPGDEDIISKQEELNEAYLSLVKSTALENAKNAVEAGDYSKAFSELKSALEKLPDDVELLNQQSSYIEEYVDVVIDSANASMEAKEYSKAETTIRTALKILPDNEELTQKLSEVQDAKPVSLSSLTALNGGFDWNEGTPTDSFGNTYNDTMNYAIFEGWGYSDNEYYAEYRVYKEYSTLTFSVAPYNEIPEEGYGQVQVYSDDKLIFTSDTINRKTDKQDYSVNISNAEYIKIVISTKGNGSSGDCILLFNCTLEK